MAASVVFVPGFMQRAEAWRPVAERLGESYSPLLLDHRMHDLGGRLAEIAEALGKARLHGPAVLAGYSMGGRLALRAALLEPASLDGLVLVGASAGIEDADARAARREADEKLAEWMEERSIEEVVERWEGQPVFSGQPPELVEAQRPGRLSHDPAELARLLRSAGQGAFAPMWSRLGELGELPVLAIAGERDAHYASAARRIADALPRGRAEVVPGAGHAAHLDQPEAVAAALGDFLDHHLGERALLHGDA